MHGEHVQRSEGIAVSGGPTSIMADLDDLEHACAGLERLEPALRDMRAPLRQWEFEVQAHSDVLPEVAALSRELQGIEAEMARVQETTGTSAASVRASVDRYRAAERGARHAVERAQYSAAEAVAHVWSSGQDGFTVDEAEHLVRNALNSVGETGLAAAITSGLFAGGVRAPGMSRFRGLVDAKEAARVAKAADASGKDSRSLAKKLSAQGRSLGVKDPLKDPAAALAGWIMDGPAGDAYDEVANWESLSQAMLRHQAQQRVEVLGPAEDVVGGPSSLDGGVGAVMGLQDQASGAGPGHIAVTQVRAADGRDTYLVTLPGTQDSPLEDRYERGEDGTPYDNFIGWGGVADAVGRKSARTGDAVAQALAAAGVPEGARVVSAGHSQGGMHAVNMLSHPTLAGRYEMVGAYTYGAPAANLPTPVGTPVLHLEDEHDLTVALDGGPNPATVDRVTVTLSSTPSVTSAEFREYVEALEAVREERDLDAVQDGWEAAQRLPAHLRDVPDRLEEHHRLSSYQELVAAQEARGPEAWGAAAGTVAALGRMTEGRVVSQKTVPLGRRRGEMPRRRRPAGQLDIGAAGAL